MTADAVKLVTNPHQLHFQSPQVPTCSSGGAENDCLGGLT
jgi:hypothetical protein